MLVIGASGGVGSYAVQLAVDLGAHVTGVCGPAKAELVRSLGAERVVDHTTTPLETLGERFDVVLDIAGHRPVRLLRGLLTERGCLVVVGSENEGRWIGGLQRAMGAALLSPFVKQRLVMFMASENGADLAALTEVIERGGVRPALERTFPLEQAAAAIDHVAGGHARGKVVVTVAACTHVPQPGAQAARRGSQLQHPTRWRSGTGQLLEEVRRPRRWPTSPAGGGGSSSSHAGEVLAEGDQGRPRRSRPCGAGPGRWWRSARCTGTCGPRCPRPCRPS